MSDAFVFFLFVVCGIMRGEVSYAYSENVCVLHETG